MQQIFLVLSVVAGLFAPIIGISSILQGSFRPQRMTRFLILLISFLFVGTLWAQGDRNSIYLASIQLVMSFVIFCLSIVKGMGGKSITDWVVFALAILSLVIWKTTNNPFLGLLASLFADMIGFVPTLIKSWKFPETEEWKFYMADVVSSAFIILSIASLSWENLAFPIYIFLINASCVVTIVLRKKTKNYRLRVDG